MTAAVNLKIPDTLKQAWETAPALVERVLTARLTQAQMLLYREVVERTPVGIGGGGGLRGSIQAPAPARAAGRLTASVGTALSYAAAVESGSKPHMPPIAPLEAWVRQKLGVKDDEVEGVAQRIAWKIKHRGTKGAFMFQNALAANQAQIERILAGAAQDVAKALAGGATA
jgi:hypothetical protein